MPVDAHAPVPRVSVIMRSFNSAWSIGDALEGVFSQEFKDFELLVVDSDSTDGTMDIVSRYPHRLLKVPATSYYPGEVLNTAIAEARGEIIVFNNSDAIPLSPETYTRLVGAFDDPEVQAAYARQVPRPEASPWVRRDYAASFPEKGPGAPWMKMSLSLAAMRRSIWQQRPFYTEAYSSEDTEWAHWAISNGYKVIYVPDAPAMHSHNYNLKQLYGRRFVEGEGDVYIFGGKDRLLGMVKRTVASVINDARWDLRHGEFADLAGSPVRRAVYHWAYYRGHKLGERRKAVGSKDRGLAQRVVKSRHQKLG